MSLFSYNSTIPHRKSSIQNSSFHCQLYIRELRGKPLNKQHVFYSRVDVDKIQGSRNENCWDSITIIIEKHI